MIDLYSDVLTTPTDEMRRAMSLAEVGYDGLGEDPTVNVLQEKAAKVTGKEAALLVPSCTMANLISVLCHCNGKGEEMLIGDESHLNIYEPGTCILGGVHASLVKNLPNGEFDLIELESKIRQGTLYPVTKLICLENTHTCKGGRALTSEYTRKVSHIAKKHNIKLHIDGARIFNASVALNTPVAELLETADSVSISICKGLCAPVGALLVGSREFIQRAFRMRKLLGGGMAQCGVLAAAGIIALDKMSLRLQDDHDTAKLFSVRLSELSEYGIVVKPKEVETNIVLFRVRGDKISGGELRERCKKAQELYGVANVRFSLLPHDTVRAVLYKDISREDVEVAVATVKTVMESVV